MLRLWTDFNDIYDRRYTRTSLRFAEFSPGEEPAVGSWAELWDYEGNRCYGVVVRIEGRIAHVKLDWTTWVAASQIPEVRIEGLSSGSLDFEWSAKPVTEDLLLKAS